MSDIDLVVSVIKEEEKTEEMSNYPELYRQNLQKNVLDYSDYKNQNIHLAFVFASPLVIKQRDKSFKAYNQTVSFHKEFI